MNLPLNKQNRTCQHAPKKNAPRSFLCLREDVYFVFGMNTAFVSRAFLFQTPQLNPTDDFKKTSTNLKHWTFKKKQVSNEKTLVV